MDRPEERVLRVVIWKFYWELRVAENVVGFIQVKHVYFLKSVSSRIRRSRRRTYNFFVYLSIPRIEPQGTEVSDDRRITILVEEI